jgi:hypothetical protein
VQCNKSASNETIEGCALKAGDDSEIIILQFLLTANTMHTSYQKIICLPGLLGQTGVLAATEDGRLASGGKY